MSERFNPYKDLQRAATEFARKVKCRKRVVANVIPADQLNKGWSLALMAESVSTAKLLGYEMHLERDAEGGLQFVFVERAPDPSDWRFSP